MPNVNELLNIAKAEISKLDPAEIFTIEKTSSEQQRYLKATGIEYISTEVA